MRILGTKSLETARQFWHDLEHQCDGHKKCETLIEYIREHVGNYPWTDKKEFKAKSTFNQEAQSLGIALKNARCFSQVLLCPTTKEHVASVFLTDEDAGFDYDDLAGFVIYDVVNAIARAGYVIVDARDIKEEK